LGNSADLKSKKSMLGLHSFHLMTAVRYREQNTQAEAFKFGGFLKRSNSYIYISLDHRQQDIRGK
jgi:hypothetical protein